jgi:hypothetical protein
MFFLFTFCHVFPVSLFTFCHVFPAEKCVRKPIEVYHAWRDAFDKIGVKVEGGLLEDASSNHFFMAVQLQDLPGPRQAQVERGSKRGDVRNDDVICLIKKYIKDDELSQPPLLVMTEAEGSCIPNLPEAKHPLRIVSPKVKAEWSKLATAVEQYYGDSYVPAAEYLRHLVQDHFFNSTPLTPIPWLGQNGARFQGQPAFQLHKCVLDALAPSAPLRAVWSRG